MVGCIGVGCWAVFCFLAFREILFVERSNTQQRNVEIHREQPSKLASTSDKRKKKQRYKKFSK